MNKKIKQLLASDSSEDRRVGLVLLKKYKWLFKLMLGLEWLFSLLIPVTFIPWLMVHFNHHMDSKVTKFSCVLEYWLFFKSSKPINSYAIDFTRKDTHIDSARAMRVGQDVIFYLTPIGNFIVWVMIIKWKIKNKYMPLSEDNEFRDYL